MTIVSSNADENFFRYSDGNKICIGDVVDIDGAREAVVTEFLNPSDPTCVKLDYEHGAIAVTPNSLYEVPLSAELKLLRRGQISEPTDG